MVVLVPFGVGPEREVLARIAPGILWVAALLAALLSLDRIFALDWEDGSLPLIATAPVPLEGVALAKGRRALADDGAAADARRAGAGPAAEPAGGRDTGRWPCRSRSARRRCR